MELREYQYDFSTRGDAMHDVRGRERKAQTMVAVLTDYFGGALNTLNLLNVGGSTGIIDDLLADHFGSVVGIDIDAKAIEHAKRSFSRHNLSFRLGDAMAMEFPDASFDVLICSQVYEHVPDAKVMMEEIFRVLKPGGICYFAANNRLMWNEPHYGLPLLSVIPRPLAHIYIRMAGKADRYHELHLSYRGLRALVANFEVVDYTRKIVESPERYGVDYLLKPGSRKLRVARLVAAHLYWLMPGYIWLLRKPVL
jgi:ubiquinone/menaquinone biosynthesis C-methylase UbiE